MSRHKEVETKFPIEGLLEVVEAAKVVADQHKSSTMRMSMANLKSAIKRLEESMSSAIE